MPQSSIAVAADFAEAMLTARRAKNWLVALILGIILIQLTLFFLVRFKVVAIAPAIPVPAVTASTQPSAEPATAQPPDARDRRDKMLQYLIGLTDFLGIVLSVVLVVVLLLIVNIMLLGRLIGISSVMSSFIWCVLLTALLFPWQAFLNNQGLTETEAPFKIPGVLYTWGELKAANEQFSSPDGKMLLLKWSRFVAFPIIAAILLLTVHAKSKRGLRMALGEADAPQEPVDQPL
jgi:hypothetical protein